MQAGLAAFSTLNRFTSAVLDESRLIFFPLSSLLESFCEVPSLSVVQTVPVPIFRFNDKTPRRHFSAFPPHINIPRLNFKDPPFSQMFLQHTQLLTSTRLSAEETLEQKKQGSKKSHSDEFGSFVIQLTEQNFDDFIKGSPLVAVLYHAAWCKMCKYVKPVWKSVSTEVNIEKYSASLAEVDITAHPDLAIREDISHLPTIKLYGGGRFLRNITTPIAHKDLMEILKNPVKSVQMEENDHPAVSEVMSAVPSRVHHLTAETLYSFLKKTPHALVLFHQRGENLSTKALEQMDIAAKSIEDKLKETLIAVSCDDNADLCTQLGVFEETLPHLRYFHFLMRKQLYYSGDFSSASILEFLRTSTTIAGPNGGVGNPPDPDNSQLWKGIPERDHVILLNDATFDRAIESQPQLLVMFYAAWCRHCATLKPVFAQAAAELAKKGLSNKLAACELVANSRIGQVQNIEFVPSFRLFEQGKRVSDHNSLRTKEEFVRLILDRNNKKGK